MKSLFPKSVPVLCALAIVCIGASSSFGQATILIEIGDPPDVGFNDPTVVTPVGGNAGTTLGQQRLIAFQFAANIWGATLTSGPPITVRATWEGLPCTATTGTLGSAGTTSIRRNFPGAGMADTWYGIALANKLAATDLNAGTAEINMRYNLNLGTTGCLEGRFWYLGLDGNQGSGVDLVAVLLHELSHGFGFQTFTDRSTGVQASGFPSIYDWFLFDNSMGKTWVQMTDAERMASAVNTGNLVWNGSQVANDVPLVLGTPRLRVNSPSSIAGDYQVGTAEFGPRLTSTGVTGNIVQALDAADGSGPSPTDGCSPLTNAEVVAGNIALIDRGTCTFVTKVRNAQNAGAVGVIIADNVNDSPPPGLGGSDSTIVIPSVRITQADGNTIKANLSSFGVNARLFIDTTIAAGTDAFRRPLMFAPNPIQSGSSVSHWDTRAFPNQLMEPNISGDLTHNVIPPHDLTFSLLSDIGWATASPPPSPTPPPSTNPIDQPDFYVRQQYADFLNRDADAAGLTFWTNEIAACGTDAACIEVKRINVSAAFYLSIEFQETGYLVYRMYKAAYGNITGAPVPVRLFEFLPDTQQIGSGVIVGQGDWQTQIENNKSTFAAEFVTRTRFTNAHPETITPAQFVDTLNQNAGGVLSQAERDQLVNDLTMGAKTRAQVLRAVAEDADMVQLEFNRAFVLMQYFGYLRRNPNDAPDSDFGGYNFWLGKLNDFNGNFVNAEMVKAFIISAEYRQRFGS